MEFDDSGERVTHADGSSERYGGEYGQQQRFGDGEQCGRSAGDIRSDGESSKFRGHDYVDDGSGVEFASGVWNDERVWLVERAERDAGNRAFGDIDRVDGIDDISLPGAVAVGAGRVGDVDGYDVHDDGRVGQPLLQMQMDRTEVSGVTSGSVVTPSIGPAGFTGAVVLNGTGSVNFTGQAMGFTSRTAA